MSGVIVTNPPKANLKDVDALARFGVATVSEAMGRTGLLGPGIRPVQQGVRVAGTAVTVLGWPGDNLMIHAAVEQCGEGDLLVVTTTSPSTDGLFGELFATALHRRGVRGLVSNAGIRDTQELRAMGFAAWSRAVSAQGTVKATGGSVNVPIAIDGQMIRPGDVILADDDGVVVVPRERARETVEKAEAREAKEAATRAAFLDGQLGLDRYGLREKLVQLGVVYTSYDDYVGVGGVGGVGGVAGGHVGDNRVGGAYVRDGSVGGAHVRDGHGADGHVADGHGVDDHVADGHVGSTYVRDDHVAGDHARDDRPRGGAPS